ncbi:MAG TPA: hypothetical protein VKB34_17750 [Povalibacter sp.]|nr:hypothetical protein [Povalibacter sp.]
MNKSSLPKLCSCLLALSASAGSLAGESERDRDSQPGELFNVPFFIENLTATVPPALRADFTLKAPAILESFSMTCGGTPKGGLLLVDGGPLGTDGTSGVGADPNVGLAVGVTSATPSPLQVNFILGSNGGYLVPPTHYGIPVKSQYSFIVFPTAPQGVACNGNVVFRRIKSGHVAW